MFVVFWVSNAVELGRISHILKILVFPITLNMETNSKF
jgi:hypothetical protein